MKIWIYVAMLFLFFGTAFYLYKRSYKTNLNYYFKGKIENVSYDEKGYPDVIIDKTSYYLCYVNWDFGHQIQKGDSLEKRVGSFTIKLTKLNSGHVIIFK